MILMLCALAVLIGGYFAVQQLNQHESVSETAGTFDLTAKKAEDLMGLSWEKDETTYTFKYVDGVWETTDTPAWPVDQEVLQDLAEQLVTLQATRKLEDVTSLADYGLETPEITVTAVWQDGSGTAYSMGDATPFADGYYLKLSAQEGTIFTIATSLSSLFDKNQKDMVAMEEIPSVTGVNHLMVGSSLDVTRKTESTTVDPEQYWYDTGTDEPLDGSQIETLVSKAQAIAWEDLVTAMATEEELDSWELDDASAVHLSISGSDGTSAEILFGTLNEDSDYYARLPDSEMVYTVDGSSVSMLMTTANASLWIKSILPMPYENLAKAEFTTEKGTWVLEKPEEAASEANAEGGSTEVAEIVDAATESKTEEGEAADEEAEAIQEDDEELIWKNLWEKVTALTASEKLEGMGSGEQIFSICAVNTNGLETSVIFTEYSADAYQAVVDGNQALLVSADDVDKLIRTIRSMQ